MMIFLMFFLFVYIQLFASYVLPSWGEIIPTQIPPIFQTWVKKYERNDPMFINVSDLHPISKFIFKRLLFKGISSETSYQAFISPANSQTLVAGNALSHRKS